MPDTERNRLMKPINIYALTRIQKTENLQRLERQMSARKHFLGIKTWETESLKSFAGHLREHMEDAEQLLFYYSFQIPRLGKEFDLLRIGRETVINIELKSEPVPDESILKQLKQNRYYLASLGKTMRSYTYISSMERLVRLTGSGKIIDTDWKYLCADLKKQTDCYEEDVEDLFRAENFIISPLSDPDRFLQKEYFLTSQQRDIERRILKKIREEGFCFQGFTGLPGTGKSLLLYDIAMKLSTGRQICLLHCGFVPEEFDQLNERLKRIDFYRESETGALTGHAYAAVLVDEAHRISREHLDAVVSYAKASGAPLIFSYDFEEMISELEMNKEVIRCISRLPGYTAYRLTNRIRINGELSSFIQALVHPAEFVYKLDYTGVTVNYANDEEELCVLLRNYAAGGYTYIYQAGQKNNAVSEYLQIDVSEADCKEFNKVVMVMDSGFYYDEDTYLRSSLPDSTGTSAVRNLFQGLNRAKTGLALIVCRNEPVFEELLTILQGKAPQQKGLKKPT